MLDDCFELAKIGRIDYGIAMRFAKFLAYETHPLVWGTMQKHANFIQQMLATSSSSPKFRQWLVTLVRRARVAAIQEIRSNTQQIASNPNKNHILVVLADIALQLDPTNEATCYYRKYFDGGRWGLAENRDLRRTAFQSYLLLNDSSQTVSELLRIANQTQLKQITLEIHSALSRTTQWTLLAGQLGKLFTNQLNPDQWLGFAQFCLNDYQHRNFMWDWARENFDLLLPRYVQ